MTNSFVPRPALAVMLALAAAGLAPAHALAAPSQCDAVAGNLVVNCGFEDGTYASTIGNYNGSVPNGWTADAGFDLNPSFNFVTGDPVNSGDFALSIGNYENQSPPHLSQSLSDSAGATLTGSLYVLYGGAGRGNAGTYFDVEINGVVVLALDQQAPATYQQYDFTFTGTGADTLTLTGNTDPNEWYVDDVVVTQAISVPEPASLAVLAAGLAVGGLGVRRKQR